MSSGSVNKAIIIGNLGADPEPRRTSAGKPVVNMRVATSEVWRDKASGERRERTTWHQVVIFNEALCGVAEKYLRKGSRVYLSGPIQTRQWEDQSGQKRYATEIVLYGYNAELVLLDSKRQDNGNGGGQQQESPRQQMYNEMDDEIPF